MQRQIHPAELGGTLFIPALHKHLETALSGEKFPALRSLVIDTEDGLQEGKLDEALARIQKLLVNLNATGPLRFLRPKDPATLSQLLNMPGIERIDGFVLPKFGLDNCDAYLQLMEQCNHPFMPSIEGAELFDARQLFALKERLLPWRERVILVRFGAEDMLRQLGMRRDPGSSLYDLCAPSTVIGTLLGVFKPAGFALSAPVYGWFKDCPGFEAEVRRDLQEGLLSKTIIHPDQIEPIERLYRVTPAELETAQKLLESDDTVINIGGGMGEVPTQRPWAETVMARHRFYGSIPLATAHRVE